VVLRRRQGTERTLGGTGRENIFFLSRLNQEGKIDYNAKKLYKAFEIVHFRNHR
jgi:hypothetical protein